MAVAVCLFLFPRAIIKTSYTKNDVPIDGNCSTDVHRSSVFLYVHIAHLQGIKAPKHLSDEPTWYLPPPLSSADGGLLVPPDQVSSFFT